MYTFGKSKLLLFCTFLFLFYSCSHDTEISTEDILKNGQVVDDNFKIISDNSSVLDVLSNDSFIFPDNVRIVEISSARNGSVVVNEDYTITYTPLKKPIPESAEPEETAQPPLTEEIDSEATSQNPTPTPEETEVELETPEEVDTEEAPIVETIEEKEEVPAAAPAEDETATSGNANEAIDEPSSEESTTQGPAPDTVEETAVEEVEDEQPIADEETETVEDSFTYTTETENEDGSVSTETGTVTVEVETKPEPEPKTNIDVEDGYFVTVNGKSGNNGLTENTAWSLNHAINRAKPGDIIYIKAGNYSNFQWVQSIRGNAGNPIKFVGYKSQPGDILSENGSTRTSENPIDSNTMPLLNGSENSGTAIKINEVSGYIEFHNIQISGYKWGINNFANNIKLRNVVLNQVGPKVKVPGNYDGKGITFRGSNNSVENGLVVDAGVEGIALRNCDNCQVINTEVATRNEKNGTDYYILLVEGTENSTIDNCTVRRKSGVEHPGHGLVAKNGASNNVIKNCTVINTGIEMSYANVHHNLIKNCSVQGTYKDNGDTASNVKVANGAHHNTFENITIDNTYGGLAFTDWDESQPYDHKDAGNNNNYINVRVTNSHVGINFGEFLKTEAAATNNTFTDCTFKNLETLIRVNRPNSNTRLINCTVENVTRLWGSSPAYNYKLNSNTVFQGMIWKNINFDKP